MSKLYPKVTIGTLVYSSTRYLDECLSSLVAQDYPNFSITVLDNNSPENESEYIQKKWPEIQVLSSEKNLGFGGGHNKIIRETPQEYYLCVNIDMIFEKNFLSELVLALQLSPTYGSSTGKILQWDFEQKKKTNFIDTVGLRAFRSHQFKERGCGEEDTGQYDTPQDLFGSSGSALLLRRSALEDIAWKNKKNKQEYFDELMFFYKEDIDLAYRLQWAGWNCRYTEKAVAWHDRTTAALKVGFFEKIKQRKQRPLRIREQSFLNQQILREKNFSPQFSWNTKVQTWWSRCVMFLYVLLFERELLSQYREFQKIKPEICKRKQSIQKQKSSQEIESFFEY